MAPKAHKKKNTRNLTSGYSVRKSFIPTRRNVRSCQFMINLSEPNALQSTSANLLPKLSLLRFYWDFSLDSGYHFWTSFQREIFHRKKTFFCANLSVSFQNEIKQCFFYPHRSCLLPLRPCFHLYIYYCGMSQGNLTAGDSVPMGN